MPENNEESPRANLDGLTGLFNRQHAVGVVTSLLEKRLAFARPVAVSLIDIDGFIRLNQRYGYEAGDAFLIGLSHRSEGVASGARSCAARWSLAAVASRLPFVQQIRSSSVYLVRLRWLSRGDGARR